MKLRLEDGWLILRASNTEPVVRVIAESSSDERARVIAERVLRDVAGLDRGGRGLARRG